MYLVINTYNLDLEYVSSSYEDALLYYEEHNCQELELMIVEQKP